MAPRRTGSRTAWEEAAALLRAVWRDASRRALVLRLLRSLV